MLLMLLLVVVVAAMILLLLLLMLLLLCGVWLFQIISGVYLHIVSSWPLVSQVDPTNSDNFQAMLSFSGTFFHQLKTDDIGTL